SRLARWAGQDGRAYFVYFHNLQAAPEYLPRSILHAVVGALTHGLRQNFYPTPLFDLAHGGALEAVHHQRVLIPWATLERAYAEFLDSLSRTDVPGAAPVDRTVYEVLYRFFRSAWRQQQGKEDGSLADLAVRWLTGQALEPVEARYLGLPRGPQPGEPVA